MKYYKNPNKLSFLFSSLSSKINKNFKIVSSLLLFVVQEIFLYNDFQRFYEYIIVGYNKN